MSDGLQFDRAEAKGPDPAGASCAACRKTLTDVYYVAQGAKICEACRSAFDRGIRAGSGAVRFLRALAFGTGAAALGTVINFLVTVKGRWGSGLISLLVGYIVGVAVRKGSGNRGGWRYQALAMALTYLSIVGMFLPGIHEEIQSGGASVLLYALVVAAPFASGKNTVLLLILIGIALYEAWKINKGQRVEFKGPFRIGGAPPETKSLG